MQILTGRLLLLIPLLGAIYPPIIAQDPWKLKKNADGIEVYYRESESSPINEIKIKTTLAGTMEDLLEVMRNVPGYTKWVYKCIQADLLDRKSQYEALYYGVMDFPWPLNDRDFIAKSKMTPTSGGKTIIEVKGLPQHLAEKQPKVRIPLLDYRWEFTQTSPKKINLEYYLRSDPGGVLPAWVINLGIDQGPTQTVKNLRQLMQKTNLSQAEPK